VPADFCWACGECGCDGQCEEWDGDRECQFCGQWECDGSGYNCNEEDYNLRDDSMVPPAFDDAG
jgi:hypothetical protein